MIKWFSAVDSLFIDALTVGVFCVWFLFCNAVLYVLFAIILLRMRQLLILLLLFSCCGVVATVLGLFLAVPWVGL